MSATWVLVLIILGLIGAAINAGAFFAFSNFVMRALDELTPTAGAEAMQAINRRAPNPVFVAAILGAGPVALPALISELDQLGETPTRWLLAGVVLSVISFLITMVGNVPMNNRLDAVDAVTADAQAYWATYLTNWTRWNTLRTLASLASAVSYAMALRGR